MQSVQQAEHPKALVEFKVVKVVELGRDSEWQVVARVIAEGDGNCQNEPKTAGGDVWAQEERSEQDGEQVGQKVLHWVAVNGHHGDRRGPLVMLLMDVLV